MKVYVFTAEQVYDGEVFDHIIKVFYTIKEAQKCLNWFVNDVKDTNQKRNWFVEYDRPNIYRAFEDGYYATNHCEFMIDEVDILNKFEV